MNYRLKIQNMIREGLHELILRRKLLIVITQLVLVVASYFIAFILRFDLDIGSVPFSLVLKTLPLLIFIRMASFSIFHLHQGLWRYVNVLDMIQIVKATTISTLAFTLLLALIFGFSGFPRSVVILDWAGNIFLLAGVRLLVRVLRMRFRMKVDKGREFTRLLIVGAGDAGAALCEQALSSPGFGFTPVAFVDDDPSKIGSSIFEVPVVSACNNIPSVVAEYRIESIVIAVPSAIPSEMRSLVESSQQSNVPYKILPATPDILEGTISISRLRDVDPSDLLGRPPARLDRDSIHAFIRGKRILVTGAGGSVGSELARQISRLDPEFVLLLDRTENSLFFLETELKSQIPNLDFTAQIADVTNQADMDSLCALYSPDVVFHAAAHKHVPLMERSPLQAVRNNIGGTLKMARAAAKSGVQAFILVSTDKAVNPTSVMGATKRVAELLLKEMDSNSSTRFMSVRFGNVLGSNASVVPIFKQQIANGGPLTVTHPDATRYFMSLTEAAGLILQAGTIGRGGETFVLDMGEPIRIVALAEMLIRLSGLRPHEDIEIVYTGLRPGEKLTEVVRFDEEEFQFTGFEKLLVIKSDDQSIALIKVVEDLLEKSPDLEPAQLKAELHAIVPEYRADYDSSTAGWLSSVASDSGD